MINVAVTDDQAIILNGLQQILAGVPHIRITGLYKNGEALLDGLKTEQPDILLLDIQMPGQSGIELAGLISKQYPLVKIIALTNVDILPQVKKMLNQGCMGYLLKDASPETIIEAIEQVYHGEQFLQPVIQQQLLLSLSGKKKEHVITRREKEILQYIVAGLSSKEIAEKLFLSLRTVENHRNNLLQKFDLKNTAALVKMAIQEGWV